MYLEAGRCNLSKLVLFYLTVRPSVGRGLRLEDVSPSKKMYFDQTCVGYVKCKAFGGSRVKARSYISRQEDVF